MTASSEETKNWLGDGRPVELAQPGDGCVCVDIFVLSDPHTVDELGAFDVY